MTTIELIKIDPKIARYGYTLHARIEEHDGKITNMRFKSLMNTLDYKR